MKNHKSLSIFLTAIWLNALLFMGCSGSATPTATPYRIGTQVSEAKTVSAILTADALASMPAPTSTATSIPITETPTSTPTLTATVTPTPTLTATVTPTPLQIDLAGAESKGIVILEIAGNNSLESINVTVESVTDAPLEITISVGTIFQSLSAGVQSMVVRTAKTIVLKSRGERATVQIAVACANMERKIPTTYDQFVLGRERVDPDLDKLLILSDFSRESFRIQQFAIWTITNNPFWGEYLIVSGWTRPTAADFQRIQELFRKAGMSTSGYNAFSPYTRLVNHHTQLCLTAQGGTIVQATCTRDDNQLWRERTGDGPFQIIAKNGGCLSRADVQIVLTNCTGSLHWTLKRWGNYATAQKAGIDAGKIPHGDKNHPQPAMLEAGIYFQIVDGGNCVDVDGWKHDEGGSIIYWPCNGTLAENRNQLWAQMR